MLSLFFTITVIVVVVLAGLGIDVVFVVMFNRTLVRITVIVIAVAVDSTGGAAGAGYGGNDAGINTGRRRAPLSSYYIVYRHCLRLSLSLPPSSPLSSSSSWLLL